MNVKYIVDQLGETRTRIAFSFPVAHRLVGRCNLSDWVALTKPRVMMLAVFTALVGMSIAPNQLGPLATLIAVLAIAAGAASAGALNMWYDADIDSVMARTATRPIPRGRVSAREALSFGFVLAGFAVTILAFAANLTAAALLAGTILFYVAVYTAWLKRTIPQNIVIGGCRRRATARYRMGRGNRRDRARTAFAVSHYFPLDAAPFLGARAQSHRRLRPRRRPDAAGRCGTGWNDAADPDLQRSLGSGFGAAVVARVRRWPLWRNRRNLRRVFACARGSAEQKHCG
jgi:hypothetical protein